MKKIRKTQIVLALLYAAIVVLGFNTSCEEKPSTYTPIVVESIEPLWGSNFKITGRSINQNNAKTYGYTNIPCEIGDTVLIEIPY